MLKKIIVLSLVGSIALLVAACGDDAKDACEHTNEKCASQQGFQKQDCSKAEENYDKLSDSDKEKADKQVECIMDANDCAAIIACATKA